MHLIHTAARMEYLGPVAEGTIPMPLMATRICAGFPSPADDWIEDEIDLQRILITNRSATFLWRVQGSSMVEVGIHDGDVVIVDRSRSPADGDVVAVAVNGEVSLKIFRKGGRLEFANRSMPAWPMHDGADIEINGVVSYCLHIPRA